MGNLEQPKQVIPENPENQSEELSLDEMKDSIETNLTELVQDGLILASQGKKAEDMLSEAKINLDKLKKEYPDDPDIYTFEKMYIDLYADFQSSQEMKLDTSFDEILQEMEGLVESMGIRRELPDDTILHETVSQLRTLDIEPEYIITQGDPDAPTVVFYMQIHPGDDPEGQEKMRSSQAQIMEGASSAIENGVISTIYTEGLHEGEEMGDVFEKIDQKKVSGYAPIDLEVKYGDRLRVQGYENPTLLRTVTTAHGTDKYRQWMHRGTAYNVLLASNISEDVLRNDEKLSFAVLGAAHESGFFYGLEKHPLPMSEALAYYGLNVIVVDAAETESYVPTTKTKEIIELIRAELPKKP